MIRELESLAYAKRIHTQVKRRLILPLSEMYDTENSQFGIRNSLLWLL